MRPSKKPSMANETYLIDHLSYSAFSAFLGNRYKFFLQYVLKTYKWKSSVAALVGKAGHMAIEAHYKGASIDAAIAHGLNYITAIPDEEVKWGKTGSREDAIQTYTQAINAFFAEMPGPDQLGETVFVEEQITELMTAVPELTAGENYEFAIPIKAVADHVGKLPNGDIVGNDWKFVKSYTDPEAEKATRLMQALFNFHAIRARLGKDPIRYTYWECKTSKNKDGAPQVQAWTVDFEQMKREQPEYFATFYRLYDAVTKELCRDDVQFLPNIADQWDGDETFALFTGETFGIDRPVAVARKTAEAQEWKPKNYVESPVNSADNINVTDEEKVRMKLGEFGLAVSMQETRHGLNVTQYTMKPSRGVRMSQFEAHANDIALALKAETVRIEAPIPGTDTVGIEVPAKDRRFVDLDADVIATADGTRLPIGVDVTGATFALDLTEAPHLLVAGATGSGKSVFLNAIIKTLSEVNTPEALQFVLIDPKRVELAQFRDIPHLLCPPIYEVEEARKALRWLCNEMEERYMLLEDFGARNLREYNANAPESLPVIVVVIDEFADLVLQSKSAAMSKSRKRKKVVTKRKGKVITEVEIEGLNDPAEDLIVRLAQKARAIGIHLVLGTQRPSVDVVTGLLKANFPTRVAFATASEVDSRVILDQTGAETLLGKGDMLVMAPGVRGLKRLQGFNV